MIYPWQLKQWQQLCDQVQENRLSHAFLVCGAKGLGKQSFVRNFANYLLCEQRHAGGACGQCRMCQLGGVVNSAENEMQGDEDKPNRRHPDLMRISIEEGSKNIKIDQIRQLAEFVNKTSHSANKKIVIIEAVDTLNGSAANALLKTLEEPTDNTFLFLISDTPGRLLATLRSRCQTLSFDKPAGSLIKQWLQQTLTDPLDDTQLDQLIAASRNQPLVAKALAASGEFEQRVQMLSDFAKVLAGDLAAGEYARQSQKGDELLLIECLANTSSILIKYLLTKNSELINSTELKHMANTLHLVSSQSQLIKQLLLFYRELETARRNLESVSNPNPQLIIETLLWTWSRFKTIN